MFNDKNFGSSNLCDMFATRKTRFLGLVTFFIGKKITHEITIYGVRSYAKLDLRNNIFIYF